MNKKFLFLILFLIVGLILLQIPVNYLVGSSAKLTLFDLFAPASGAFIGTGVGVVSVLLIQIVNLAIHGFSNFDKAVIIRLFPTLFAVWYFAPRTKEVRGKLSSVFSGQLILLVPICAMISFNLNPVGRSVWFYSLFWLIPLLTYPFKNKFLLARSLGATFTAHAVGGAIWIWVFKLPPGVWVSLIPVVIMERGIFALGICASYILTNNVLALLVRRRLLTRTFLLDKRFIFSKLRIGND